MPKKLLLVDDEESFLLSVKDGLIFLSDIFETDICFSVDEAIKRMASKQYDLVITDIRMPEKSGIDLLLYLRQIHFPGKVMIMSAYSPEDSSGKTKSLGAIDVISKPFMLDWFKDLLLDRFNKEKSGPAANEPIDLITLMQVINLEKKTTALQIDIHDKQGVIYFVDGEIIHAQYENLEGEPAVMKLITLNGGTISVKKNKDPVKPSIEIPFVECLIKIMKTIEEIRRDRNKEDR